MSERTPPRPDHDKTPRSYVTEPPRHVEHVPLPPGIGIKPDRIELKHNVFAVSVMTMVFTSLITFYIPLLNGLLGGTFGGYHAGRMKRALGAALVSSVMVPAILLFAFYFGELDPLRFFWGLGNLGWIALHVIGTFIGAIAGAASRPLITERTMFRYSPATFARQQAQGGPPAPPADQPRHGVSKSLE